MIVYPMTVESHQETGPSGHVDDLFIARFPDIPELMDCIGVERSDAIGNGVERLGWALTEIYLDGRPMPPCSPVDEGQIGVPAPFIWAGHAANG